LLKDNLDGTLDFKVRVVCSAGTYIRTLAEDFGKRLGLGAHVAELRRTRVGGFKILHTTTLEELQESVAEESLGRVLLTPDAALAHLPVIDLTNADVRKVSHGMNVEAPEAIWTNGEHVRLRDGHGHLIAIASFEAEKQTLRPRVVLAHDQA
jgi:tRNA pseudouridine55 synthase